MKLRFLVYGVISTTFLSGIIANQASSTAQQQIVPSLPTPAGDAVVSTLAEGTSVEMLDHENTLNWQTTELELPAPTETIQSTHDEIFTQSQMIFRDDSLAEIWQQIRDQLASDATVANNTIASAIQSDQDQELLKRLIPGRELSIGYTQDGQLTRLDYIFQPVGQAKMLILERKNQQFISHISSVMNEKRLVVRNLYFSEQTPTIFASADAANIPDSITLQLGDILGSEIDLYHDFQSGDQIQLAFEVDMINGDIVRYGKIQAINLNAKKKQMRVFLFDDGKKAQYYDGEGKSLVKNALWRTPLKFSRITSSFSKARFHPILQTWKAHRGIDYAAPLGTPVYATADGVVQLMGDGKGYGNLIVLKHTNQITTFYAHLQKFSPKLKLGQRVRQGDIIAFVGQTGWATGPHLHYEFRVKEEPIDPLSVKTVASNQKLIAKQQKQFNEQKNLLVAQLASVVNQRDWQAFE